MALVLVDRVKVRSQTAGTGTITLADTALGFQSFEIVGNGNETYYGIVDNVGNWEIGRGTYTNVSTVGYLSRDSVISSSNNNAKINFPVGGKNVFGTFPSSLAQNIIGSVSQLVNGSATASLGTDGLLAVPGRVVTPEIEGASDGLAIYSDWTKETGISIVSLDNLESVTLTSDRLVAISTNFATLSQKDWIFETTGNLKLPAGGDIVDSNGTSVLGGTGTTDRLTNGLDEIVANVAGGITFPNSAVQRDTGSINCQPGVDTVVFTSSQEGIQTIKLLLEVEGTVTTGDADTQSCEMIVAKSFRGPTVATTVYAVVHTSVAPLATFTAEWNVLISRVEVTCRPTSLTNNVTVKSFATEITTSD